MFEILAIPPVVDTLSMKSALVQETEKVGRQYCAYDFVKNTIDNKHRMNNFLNINTVFKAKKC